MLPHIAKRRFVTAQGFALLLLLLFAAQALYLAARTPLGALELQFVHPEMRLDRTEPAPAIPASTQLSPLTSIAARAFFRLHPVEWVIRLPFVGFGVLLGASLWYIARRLYGNTGGSIALALFVFSPTMITYAARVQPEIAAAWGAFGCVFTGIAVAHTLYAPREVVLWNWKRILLLGIATGLGIAAEFGVVAAFVLTALFLLYLVPERRRAALGIIAAGAVIGFAVVAALYGFHLARLAAAARTLGYVGYSVLERGTIWRLVALFLYRNGPGFVLLLATALITYLAWPRSRYFGNSAPLVCAAVLIVFGFTLPHAAGFSFLVVALPFVFLFTAGILTDLLETRQASLLSGIVVAALLVHAYFSMMGLVRLQ